MNEELKSSDKALKRPLGVYLLIVVFILLSWMGWLRVQQGFAYREIIVSYNIKPGLVYFILSGAAMGSTGLVTAIGLWWRKSWAGILSAISAILFACWYWIDELFISISTTNLASHPFKMILTVIVLLFFYLILFWSYQRGYFGNGKTGN
jgi:hypothetical protein